MSQLRNAGIVLYAMIKRERTILPTVLRVGPYRFYFFSNEGREPAHIHVQAGGDQRKFWLDPVTLAINHGFAARELNEIASLVTQHRRQ